MGYKNKFILFISFILLFIIPFVSTSLDGSTSSSKVVIADWLSEERVFLSISILQPGYLFAIKYSFVNIALVFPLPAGYGPSTNTN